MWRKIENQSNQSGQRLLELCGNNTFPIGKKVPFQAWPIKTLEDEVKRHLPIAMGHGIIDGISILVFIDDLASHLGTDVSLE